MESETPERPIVPHVRVRTSEHAPPFHWPGQNHAFTTPNMFQHYFRSSERQKLTGNTRLRIRFGMALTALGDINMDGFFGKSTSANKAEVFTFRQRCHLNTCNVCPFPQIWPSAHRTTGTTIAALSTFSTALTAESEPRLPR